MSVLDLDNGYTMAAVAAGVVSGAELVQLNGRNTALSTSAETFWGDGAMYTPLFSAGAAAMEVVSSSAADDAGGIGAITLDLEMVQSDYTKETLEGVALNGTAAVSLGATTYLGCNKIRIATLGSSGYNNGIIRCRIDSGGAVQGRMSIGPGYNGPVYDSAIYTIPKNHIGLLLGLDVTFKTLTGEATGAFRLSKENNQEEMHIFGHSTFVDAALGGQKLSIDYTRSGGFYIPEKTTLDVLTFLSAGVADGYVTGQLLVLDKSKNVLGL